MEKTKFGFYEVPLGEWEEEKKEVEKAEVEKKDVG